MKISDINPFLRNIIKIQTVRGWKNKSIYGIDSRIFYILQGSASIKIEGELYTLSDQSLIYLPAGKMYEWIDWTDNFVAYIINFDFTKEKSSIKNCFSPALDGTVNDIFFDYKIDDAIEFSDPIILNALNAEKLVKEIYELYLNKKIFYEEYISVCLKNLLLLILQTKLLGQNKNDKIVNKILAQIHDNFSDPTLSNEKICSVVHYHPYYVNEIIKSHTGMTIHKYLMNLRLYKASEMLLTSDDSIESISEKTGFDSYDTFRKAFKKEFDMLPLDYRRKNR